MSVTENENINAAVNEMLIRDLVEQYPDAMPVLQQYGIDICCGGGLTIPAAAEAHGYDPDALAQHVRQVVSGEGK